MSVPIELTGTLKGLRRTVHANGGERISFRIETAHCELWSRLLGLAEGDVSVSLLPQQGALGLEQAHGNGPERRRGRRKKKAEAPPLEPIDEAPRG
jgi:hypothetical protein